LEKPHFGIPGDVFVWGKPHASKSVSLQALENVTTVTFALLKQRRGHEGAHESVKEGAGNCGGCTQHAMSSAM